MNTRQTETHRQRGRAVHQPRHGYGRWLILAVAVTAIVLVAAAGLSMRKNETSQPVSSAATQPGGHFMDPKDMRSVKVAAKGTPMVLDEGGTTVAVVTLLEGAIPEGATEATVKTDEDCAPDTSGATVGWSHCRNRLVFDNGSQAVVQHHHKLADVGCFTPGQVIKFA